MVAGRTYEDWAMKAAPCSLRVLTGVPCVACGGTRAVKALAHGEIVAATQYNPLVVVAVSAVVLWFVWTVATMGMARYRRGAAGGVANHSSGKAARRWGIVLLALVLLNWMYLVFFLPP